MAVVPCASENGHVVVFDRPIRVGACFVVFEADKVFVHEPVAGGQFGGQIQKANELFGVFGWDAHNVRMM